MKVTRLPKDPGPAAWNAILPDAPHYPALDDNTTADWLVVGAGFTGLAAARRLTELHPGDRITILDAKRVADGPAGRNSGFMIDLPHDLTSEDYGGNFDQDYKHIRLNRAGIAFAFEAAEAFGMNAETIALSGKVNAAASTKGMQHNADYSIYLDKLGEPHEMFDAQQMHDLTGINYYEGGLYSPGTAMIQPAAFIRQSAAGIVSNRVTLHENSPVVTLDRTAGTWVATTTRGSIAAPKVILAVNGHAESFGHFDRQLMHIFTYGSMTRPLTREEITALGGRSQWGLTPADPLGTTVRRISGTGGDRIVIRNRATYDPSMEVSDARIADVARTHDKSFADRFPMLRGVAMDYRWGGRLCLSRNNVPAFGEVDSALYAACCQNGLGTAKGTISGKLIAELASGHTSPLLDDMLSEAAPSRLPPPFLAAMGANAIMRWGEFRAGKEL